MQELIQRARDSSVESVSVPRDKMLVRALLTLTFRLLPQITHYAGQMLTKYPLVFAYLMRIAQRANLASASASVWKK